MHIRPFQPTDDDYAIVIAINNESWPDDPETVEELKHSDATKESKYFFERYICEAEKDHAASGVMGHVFWSHRDDKYFMSWDVRPAFRETADPLMFQFFFDQLIARGATEIMAFAREDKTWRTDLLKANGFEIVMRYPVSQLLVEDFPFEAYEELPAHLADQGVTIYTLNELREREPKWAEKLEEAEWAIIQDIPSPDRPTREGFDKWLKQFENPNRNPESYFVAVAQDGEIVGISFLDMSAGEKLYTNLTGVKRAWRRGGIATALKVRGIQFAKGYGAKIIETDNEENNPMYDLNLRLGFEPRPAYLDLQWRKP